MNYDILQSGWREQTLLLVLCECWMLCLVAQSCQTLCDPMNCSLPGSIHGILLAGILEWVARPSSRGSSQPKNRTHLPHCRQILYCLSHKGSPRILEWVAYPFSSRPSWPRNQTGFSCVVGRFFINWTIKEAGHQSNWNIYYLGSKKLDITKIF